MLMAEMANPVQQGLKPGRRQHAQFALECAEMANPVQQGLKPSDSRPGRECKAGRNG